MHSIDLRVYKQNMRNAARQRREQMNENAKNSADKALAANVARLRQYAACHTVLVYVSTPSEIDTFGIISRCLADGKKVAVPRCIPNTRDMEFHYIESVDQLAPGAFGVLEPSAQMPVFDLNDCDGVLMLLPALVADHFGFRLGYGKGYYDRYMGRFSGNTVVLCYDADVVRRLTHGKFDAASDVLVTDKYIRTINREKGGINGRV